MTARADILVIKFSALGDVVMAFPAFARIRAGHPNAPITLLTTPPFEALAKASPYFDRVWADGRPDGGLGWLGLILRLRRARFARVYDLQGNDRTRLIRRALGPFAPVWSEAGPAEMHPLERHARQLQQAGIWPDAPTAPMSAPAPDVSWLIGGADRAPGARPVALLIPGSAATRPLKRWPAERYGALAAALIERGFDVAVIGAEPERALAGIIRQAAPAVRDLTGKTDLAAIARLAASAAIVVGNDTGPTHLAAAAGAPTVALFSSDSSPALSAPRGAVTVVQRDTLTDLDVAEVLAATEGRALNKDASARI
jgi:ADP-heptose:LPS heptosyltransferase